MPRGAAVAVVCVSLPFLNCNNVFFRDAFLNMGTPIPMLNVTRHLGGRESLTKPENVL